MSWVIVTEALEPRHFLTEFDRDTCRAEWSSMPREAIRFHTIGGLLEVMSMLPDYLEVFDADTTLLEWWKR